LSRGVAEENGLGAGVDACWFVLEAVPPSFFSVPFLSSPRYAIRNASLRFFEAEAGVVRQTSYEIHDLTLVGYYIGSRGYCVGRDGPESTSEFDKRSASAQAAQRIIKWRGHDVYGAHFCRSARILVYFEYRVSVTQHVISVVGSRKVWETLNGIPSFDRQGGPHQTVNFTLSYDERQPLPLGDKSRKRVCPWTELDCTNLDFYVIEKPNQTNVDWCLNDLIARYRFDDKN
jgi:hypothetical protein